MKKVLDMDKMIQFIIEKTGLDYETVVIVLETEEEFMVQEGIII